MNRQNGNKNAVEGIVFSIFGVVFMLFWIYTALKGGAYFVGLAFGGFGLFSMVRNLINQIKALKNGGNVQYYDQNGYDEANSSDPWDVSYPDATERYGMDRYGNPINIESTRNFCPYCGIPVKQDHVFCKNCGRQLTD